MDDERLSKHQADSLIPRLAEASAKRAEKDTSEHSKKSKRTKILKSKFLILFVVIVFLFLSALLVGIFILGKNNSNKQIACTLEAKVCPDGSSVGRTGPNCEFTKCPEAISTETPSQSSAPTSKPTSEAEAILKIPEYGVQVTLSDEIKDAYYNGGTASKGYVYLKVHSLDSEPQCMSDESSTAALSRAGKDEINPMTNEKYSDSSSGKTIGDYFYNIDLAQYSCAESVAGKAKLEKVRKAFSNASSYIGALQ